MHTGRPPRGALTRLGVVSETPATGVPAQQLTPPNPSPQTPPAESGEGPAFGHTLGPVESVTTSHVTGGPQSRAAFVCKQSHSAGTGEPGPAPGAVYFPLSHASEAMRE